VAYTYKLVSPQDFPIGFLEEFYKIIQGRLKSNYIKIS
jgi:hypothetical protein